MTTAKERVEIEYNEVTARLAALDNFSKTPKYESLSDNMKTLLDLQWLTMQQYAIILKQRLEIWED